MYKNFIYTTGMETKKLEIQQAVEWEKFNKTVENFDEFKKELIINGVNDVFSSMKIKQDKTKYLFSLNGTNIFAVNGKTNVVSRLQKYYEEKWVTEKWSAEQQVLIRMEWLELQYIKSKTQDELDVLKTDIAKASNLETKTTDIENVKYKVERLITIFEQERDLAKESSSWFSSKYDKKDDNLRKIHKKEIERRLKELNKIKKQIELLTNNKGKIYEIKRDIDPIDNTKEVSTVKEVKMDDVNAMDMTMTLKQLSDRIEEIGKEVPDFITTRNDIILEKGDTNPYYEIIIHDKSDARKISKSLKKINNQYAILDKLELTAAKRQALSQDLQDLETYLNKVIDNPDTFKPSENPFVPTHAKEFAELIEIDPTLAAFTKLNTEAGKTETQVPATWAGTTETGTTEKTKTWTEYITNTYTDSKEAFEKWGIGWAMRYWLDKSNMTESQKQMRWWVGNLALTGGIIFVGWKMISSAFKLLGKKGRNKENLWKNLGRLLGPAAVIFWAQARSGEWPLSLFKGGKLTEKMANMFGRWSKNPDIAGNGITQTEAYTEGFVGLMWTFDGMTYGNMTTFLEETNDGKLRIREDQYDAYIAMLENGNDNQKAGAKFLKKHVGKEDKNGVMDLTLRSMGIEGIKTLNENPDKPFEEAAAGAAARVYSVHAFMEKEGYSRINPETMPLIEAYIADTDATVDDLEDFKKRGDVFDITEAVTDKTGMAAKIKLIAPTDTEKERYLLNGINDFYDYRPTTDKSGLDIIGTWPVVEFKTYGYTTKINLDNKKIDGLSATDKFGSYAELFKAANLTNRLKYLCKDRTAVKENPFYIQSSDLMFDDAKVFSLSFDTEMVEEQTLKTISPTLSKFNIDYVNYLNNITPKIYKEAPAK